MRGLLLFATLALAGCGQAGQESSQSLQSFDVSEPAAAPAAPAAPIAAGGGPQPAPIAVSLPQMAYKYGYTYRLPEGSVAAAQARHMALCDRLGPSRCQLVAMSGTGGENAAGAGLTLRVASGIARAFGGQLTAAVARVGGRAVNATIQAEDVSKKIVDTEARLRQRELLVARLTDILRTRQGKVAELVEAERSVAAAQEEIDQARSWLAELRGRVAMATIEIGYEPVAPSAAAARGGVGDAVSQSLSAFVAGLGALLQIVIFLLPWALLAAVIWLATRQLLPRWRAWRDRA